MYLIKQLKITIQLQTEIIAFTLSVTENENDSMGFLRITGDSFLYSEAFSVSINLVKIPITTEERATEQ